jgi:hypothetical protein
MAVKSKNALFSRLFPPKRIEKARNPDKIVVEKPSTGRLSP